LSSSESQDHVSEPLIDFPIKEKRAKSGSGEDIHLETQLRLHAIGRPNVGE
jgi:hypothetical protein